MIKALKESIVELNGRERAQKIMDNGTFRELISPFEGIESPHLSKQGIVPQSDDGVIVAKGKINQENVVVISIEGEFQGGGIGEVSGAKIAGALEKALMDCEKGNKIIPIILFDTGGVRLQEANYGLLSIAEIHAAIVALRKYVPVIAVIPGKVGAFGGMSITAGLCSSIIMTREGRLGLNGPEVIEQEAGIREFDSKDRILTWRTLGGAQRLASGFADILIDDDVEELKETLIKVMTEDIPDSRTEQISKYEECLNAIDPTVKLTPDDAMKLLDISNEKNEIIKNTLSNSEQTQAGRGEIWFDLLRDDAMEIGDIPSVRVADSYINNKKVRYIAVVPDRNNPFPRAREGEVGLREGWSIAKYVWEAIEEDQGKEKRAIIPIVDVPSQAYGYNEELLGIYQSCAAAVNAYASARLSGHPVISFIPGKAISGAFLSHGMQSHRLIALRDPGVNVHVMSKNSAALITQRTLEELEEVTKKVPAMAYDIESFKTLGALYSLVEGIHADSPTNRDKDLISKEISEAIEDVIKNGDNDLSSRLKSSIAVNGGRTASIFVREKIEEQWN